jgi:3-methylcrotonyl-CoA carboxylase alpha subunit
MTSELESAAGGARKKMQDSPIRRVLVANRGEIACRIIQGIHDLGLEAVAVFSEPDQEALHVRRADAAVAIGPAEPRRSYLDIERIVGAALSSGCQAVHPGYGFLSENADFAEAVERAGLRLVGPSSRAIREMGSKARARALMEEAGVPVVPGYHGEEQSEERFLREAERIGCPVLVKAAAGGGGKGMRIVRALADLPAALEGARREAEKAFADGRLLIERYLERPRHVEIQVLGDLHGGVVHLFERDCSVQRRHQKVIEESPAPLLPAGLRERMGEAAVRAAKAVGYSNAGTVEFVVDAAGNAYFLEMNTRLQVEHPVTELVTGLDLVELQLRIAGGEPLPLRQEEIGIRGAAMEARLYAEDPASGFLPSAGRILRFDPPSGAGIRVDSGIESGVEVTIDYDPILAKVIAFGSDREQARRRLLGALDRTVVFGVRTNLAFLRTILAHPEFAAGRVQTHFIEDFLPRFPATDEGPAPEALAAAMFARESAPSSPAGPMGPNRSEGDPWSSLAGWGRS